MKITEVKEYRKDGSILVKGYKFSLSKTGIETTGFTKDDDLKVEYLKDKIIITK